MRKNLKGHSTFFYNYTLSYNVHIPFELCDLCSNQEKISTIMCTSLKLQSVNIDRQIEEKVSCEQESKF